MKFAARGKRKTQDPCPGCGLHRARCLCAEIPGLALRTRVTLIIHVRELRRTTNSGMLAVRALSNSEHIVRGDERTKLDLSRLLDPRYRAVLFFPSVDAVELNSDFVAQDPRPLHLIVPDGNWRQASKVAIRHPELSALPRVTLSAPNLATAHLRAESRSEGMSTLQAIARAMSIAESAEAGAELEALYQLKLQRTLAGRPGRDVD